MIKQLQTIVREASSLMLTDTFEISQKDGYANIVTSSDVAVQEFLKARLSELMPGSAFIAEEGDAPAVRDKDDNGLWIIDPIDGTANYSRGIRECAICVGLRQHGEMQMAVVYLPRTDEMFYAEKGRGAYLNGRQIHVSNRPFADAVLCTALAVYYKEHAQVCADIIVDDFMQCNDIRRFGAAAPELCYVAMGRCELYFEYLLSPWDFAAASLILTEAGGVLSDLNGNSIDPTRRMGVLAANNQDNLNRLTSIVKKHL